MKRYRKTKYDSLATYEIARKLGLSYMGDVNLVHGGYFYSMENWAEHGHVDAVEIQISENTLFVDIGCINKIDDPDLMFKIRDQYGCSDNDINPAMIVDYCHGQFGVENTYNESLTFKIVDDYDIGEYFEFGGMRVMIDDSLQSFVVEHYLQSIAKVSQ